MNRWQKYIVVVIIVMAHLGCTSTPKKDYPITPIAFTAVQVTDHFWLPRMEINYRTTIPFAFKKCEETGRIDNFAKAGKLMAGDFEGRRYNDSDVFKVMEGAAYTLRIKDDPQLEAYLEDLIKKVAAAQEEDGYLYTTRTINPDHPAPGSGAKRWSNLGSSHELYNVGHMYEAAVAHYRATGRKNFLKVALKSADLIQRTFGPGKRQGYPGHQEIEIGLVKLYRVTGRHKYLELARYFLDQRGRIKDYLPRQKEDSPFSIYNQYWYLQAHKPVTQQRQAIGHAVRAAYMYSGMADVAALTGDQEYITALNYIWDNVVSKKLYITGGIGSRHDGESFGADYELPNATAYNETCAAIGNVFWNHRLFLLHGDGKYMDVLERTLYNGLLSGISLSGDRFFYPNPLESDGKYAFNQGETTRKPWFDCACCPVNLTRFLPSLPGYIYAQKGNTLYVNLFIQSKAHIKIGNGSLTLEQTTRYPWQGNINIMVKPEKPTPFTICVRIPGWARNQPVPSDLYSFQKEGIQAVNLLVNRKPWPLAVQGGYISLARTWKPGDQIQLSIPMPIKRIFANPRVADDRHKVALQRGPLVFCFEGIDNDGSVLNQRIPDDLIFQVKARPDLLGGIITLTAKTEDTNLVAIPYYAWSHRGSGEMAVWLPRETKK